MNSTTVPVPTPCLHCGMFHGGGMCPRVKSIEYDEHGRIKRVQYHDPLPPPPVYPIGWWPETQWFGPNPQWVAPPPTCTIGGMAAPSVGVSVHS